MTWRLAQALDILRAEINAEWPNRSKVSDGTIGDARHQAEMTSQHNPNAAGVVTAIDITNDLTGNGPTGGTLAEHFVTLGRGGDPRIWYVVWNRSIWSVTYGFVKRPYTGSDPHTNHVHLSLSQDRANYDSTAPWGIAKGADVELTDTVKNGPVAAKVLGAPDQSVNDVLSRTAAFARRADLQSAQALAIVQELAARQGVDTQAIVDGVAAKLDDLTLSVNVQ